MSAKFKMTGNSDKDLFDCAYPEWQEQRESTTFWDDFTIADCFGEDAVRDTCGRCFDSWKNHFKYLTELVCVLNHKIWQHYELGDSLAPVYNELWEVTDGWAKDHLKGDELKFYLYVLD